MPRFGQLFKDTAPPLVFSEGWQGGTSETDPALDQYAQASYTYTQKKGASMTFSFNGTFVGIYGAKRPGYGKYTIKLDNHVFPALSASSKVAEFNQTLFQTTVPNGLHTITLINEEDAKLDVDYAYFEGQVGREDEELISSTFQDTDPAFQYFPKHSWAQSPRPGTFSASTGTITTDPNASLEYKFEGIIHCDVILLYGTVTPTAESKYLVSVDNGPWHTFSSRKASVRPHQVLYYAGNLGRGIHNLKLKFADTNATDGIFQVDFTNIYSAPSLGARPSPEIRALEARSLQTLELPERYIPKSVIVGLSFTSLLAIFALAFSLSLLWRQRKQKKERKFERF